MTNEEQSIEQRIELGLRALELLENPTFQLAVNTLSGHFVNQTFATKPEERELREIIYHQQLALQGVVGILNSWHAAGKEAEASLAEDEIDAADGGQEE